MPGSEDPAKYLNSPETPLFTKSRVLYGLDQARQRIVETRTVAIVEGYTDVVMAHQYGVRNVVAPLGTAMTEQHVTTLRRFADKIVLLFDADTAGDTAVNRAVELFLTQPIEIAIASMPEGVDPDEYLIANGAEAFEQVLATASDALAFKWKLLDRRFAASDDLTGRQKAVEEYLGTLAAARGSGPVDSIRWGQALARVSRLTEVPVGELNKRFKTASPRVKVALTRAVEQFDSVQLTVRERAERWVLAILLSEPHRWAIVQRDIGPKDFAGSATGAIAELYWAHQRDEGEPVFNEFLAQLTDKPGLSEFAIRLVEEFEGRPDIDRALADAVDLLQREKNVQKHVAELRRTSDAKDAESEALELFKKIANEARTPDLRRVGF
jgi:DNA primase